MAAKRHRDDYEENSDQPGEKKLNRPPSFSKVIREAIMVKSLENFFMAIEPHLRRVVQEEIQKGLNNSPHYIDRPPQTLIQSSSPSPLQLAFKSPPNLPIFTGTKIESLSSNSLHLHLLSSLPSNSPSLPSSLKLELLVLDGDFPFHHSDDWSAQDFNKWVVRERQGKRPLLTGDVSNVIMRGGEVSIGDLQFTDNSSWIRSRNFRIAARVVAGSNYEGPRIREGITDKFVVRDHRGELYKKHYPPSLHDEVWRLDKIGKDGAFHRKLSENKINNVEDFLKLLTVNPNYLRSILGLGMSDKMWEIVITHAQTCNPGEKIYIHTGQNVTIYLNSICQIINLMIDGVQCSLQNLPIVTKKYVQDLVLDAYRHWYSLREVDSVPNSNIALIQSETVIQGGLPTPFYPTNQENGIMDFQIGGLDEEETSTSLQVAYTGSFHFNPYN